MSPSGGAGSFTGVAKSGAISEMDEATVTGDVGMSTQTHPGFAQLSGLDGASLGQHGCAAGVAAFEIPAQAPAGLTIRNAVTISANANLAVAFIQAFLRESMHA